MSETAISNCTRCKGFGWYWRTPDSFNPFLAGGFQTALAMHKVSCICADVSPPPQPRVPATDLQAENERLRAALEKLVDWASRRCPADDESVPCPLCGARADIPGDFCKAVESIFPRDLLRDTRAALERT